MKLSKLMALTTTALFAGGLAACSASDHGPGDDALEGVPEQAALELSATEDAESESLATEADGVDPASEVVQALSATAQAVETQPAAELTRARGAIRELNQALRAFMQPIAALVRDVEPSSVEGRTKTWGPITRGPTEYRFVLRHGTLRHYGWLLQARSAGSATEFRNVAAGGITVGFAPRRGRGSVGLDLDALSAVDPTVVARGTLFASFAHGARGSVVGYRLRDFTSDPQKVDAFDALVQGVHLQGGYNRLRLAFRGNLPETATDAAELVLARVRHNRGVGGRADALLTGGDVADGKVWVLSECWSPALDSVYRVVRECPNDGVGGARCSIVATHGDVAACAPGFAAAELPPANPLDPMSDPESPEGDVTPPDTMPDGNPPRD